MEISDRRRRLAGPRPSGARGRAFESRRAHSGNTAPRRPLVTGGAFALRGSEGQLSHINHPAQVTPPATTKIELIDRVHW